MDVWLVNTLFSHAPFSKNHTFPCDSYYTVHNPKANYQGLLQTQKSVFDFREQITSAAASTSKGIG